ncbi:MAG: conjugal transfer protein TraF [Desulfurococcales archaeon]|jgi:cytochrome c biogenesis protein CcdA|nr:conjugal transfer protein TraF [Desulfurococcales archaeon]
MRIHSWRNKRPTYGLKTLLAISAVIWILIVFLYPIISHVIGYQEPITQISGKSGTAGNSKKDFMHNGTIFDIYEPSQLDILSNLTGYNLLYFEQSDCPGCKELSPAINRFFSSSSDISIRLIRIHIDNIFYSNQEVALRLISSYGVPGTPTLILVRDGIEIARHIGVFRGDQYDGLKSFIESGISMRTAGSNILAPMSSLSLGLLASISPCSLPMVAIFATSTRLGAGFTRVMKVFISLIGALLPISLGIGLASNTSRLFGFSIYYALITYIATLTLAWGILTIAGREPLLSMSGRSAVIFPVLGMQCSFPFLLAVISTLPREPIAALISSLAFSIGYTTPYIGSNIFLNRLLNIVSDRRWNRVMNYMQGVILISVGIYVLITGIPYVID